MEFPISIWSGEKQTEQTKKSRKKEIPVSEVDK